MRSEAETAPMAPKSRGLPSRRLAMVMAVLAGLAVVVTLDGPGLTIDEPLDVRPGRTYLKVLFDRGWHFFDRAVVDSVFRDNAEHPPLGRWLLGIASVLGEPFEVLWKGADPTGQYVLAGRLAPALAFAALAGLVALEAGRLWGPAAGTAAAFALMAMPRVFAHAHLAALDTFLSLFWTLALITGTRAVQARRPAIAMTGAGAVWSLALLTKIHAWLLLPILGAWALFILPPRRALAVMAIWALVGVSLFWAGWPWLWYAPWARLQAYWGTGVAREPIMVQYFGRVVADRDVPWHYPWFYFAVTVPAGLHALGAIGIARGWKDRAAERLPLLLAGTILVFLALFSTRVPIYDGERLFLLVFPAWSLLMGMGFGWLWNYRRAGSGTRIALAFFLIAQGYGTVALHPFGLSYYNGFVGGLPGAQRLGLELTYWNDAVDPVLLDHLASAARPGASAALVPTLYPGQGILTTNRALARRRIVLADEQEGTRAEWLVVSRRTAYWRREIADRLRSGAGRRVAARQRQGVWLGALWHFPAGAAGDHAGASPPPHSPFGHLLPRGREGWGLERSDERRRD
jgi:4-amino-4-deoxy-L-arabinose transferase-like glycosyltransferase